MLFRTNFAFENETTSRQAHRSDHKRLHEWLNTRILVMPDESIADALTLAANNNISVVHLQPGAIYNITETLNVPQGVVIDGGSLSFAGSGGAVIRATGTTPFVMFSMAHSSGLRGLRVQGNNASVGALIQSIGISIKQCSFTSFTVQDNIAIKFGGALYCQIEDCNITSSNYAIDALDAYAPNPAVVYYGVNKLYSRNNAYGPVRVEGIMTSLDDKFELTSNAPAVVEIGGTVQSKLTMVDPYFELYEGDVPLVAIKVGNASRLVITGGQMFCAPVGSSGSIAILCNGSGHLSIHGLDINRFETGFSGQVYYAPLDIAGVHMRDVTAPDALTYYPASDANVFNYVSA